MIGGKDLPRGFSLSYSKHDGHKALCSLCMPHRACTIWGAMLRGAGGHVTIPMGCSQRFYGLCGAGKGLGRGGQRMSTEWCEGEGPREADIA